MLESSSNALVLCYSSMQFIAVYYRLMPLNNPAIINFPSF